MACGCNKKKDKKKIVTAAKKTVQKRKLPLVTIRRKPVTKKK